jgi:hypothetical protein
VTREFPVVKSQFHSHNLEGEKNSLTYKNSNKQYKKSIIKPSESAKLFSIGLQMKRTKLTVNWFQRKKQNSKCHDNFGENKSIDDRQIQVTSMTCKLHSILLHLLAPPISLFGIPHQSVADQKLPKMMVVVILCNPVDLSLSQRAN